MDEVKEVPLNASVKLVQKESNGLMEDPVSEKDNSITKQNVNDSVLCQEDGDLNDIKIDDTKDSETLLDSSSVNSSDTNHCDTEKKNSLENHISSPERDSCDKILTDVEEMNVTDTVFDESNEREDKESSLENQRSEPNIKDETPQKSESEEKEKIDAKQPEEEISSSTDVEKDVTNTDKETTDKGLSENLEVPDGNKKKEEEKEGKEKKKKGKICVVCEKKKKIEFRIHFQGKVQLICGDQCYKKFKEKQAEKSEPKTVASKTAETASDSFCPQCQKLVFPNLGFYPVVGEIKPLCSEECVRKYQENNGPPRKCSQCEKKVEDKSIHLTWETMVFCGEDCLGKYQSFLGSHCTCCQAPVQQPSLGKYCVCFGSDIRQFCSGSCLDDFKKGLKVCTFCQTDLSAGTDGFLAPVGDKGQFKDFCSQSCMERYETMNNISKTTPEVQECAHCKKQGTFKIQVPYKDKKYFLCCDSCVSGLRCTLKKTDNVCASCHRFFVVHDDLNENKVNDFKFKMDGLYKFFCTKTCMTTYVLSHRRITQCLFCKVKKYNFDMIEKVDKNDGGKIFCSLNCLSLFRVNANAASTKSVRCDNCSKNSPAQYHLTMSDGSIRNFCAYSCVLAFQNQFTSVPALTTTSMTRQVTTPVQTLKTTPAISSPVIANVMSLAQGPRAGSPALSKPLVPQTLVSVRPTRQPVAVFTTKPPVSTVSSPTVSVVQSSSTGSQVMREVIIQPPAPKSVKNKTVWCKPIMQTKGIIAKISACHKAVQTDDNPRPIILPVPIPVYVPTPLHMFSRPVPCPVPFPVPIPVPIIIPSSKEHHLEIVKHLKSKQEDISCNSQADSFNTNEKALKKENRSQSDEAAEGVVKGSHKRTLSPEPTHSNHKKLKPDEDSGDNEPLSLSAVEHQESSPVVFETPSFSFDDEEQTMLKVP